MKANFTCFLFFILFSIQICYSQINDVTLKHYSVNDGLSQSTVTTFFQDAYGFMWIGTGDGLNRFDGYKFVVYKKDFFDDYSIVNNSIRDIKHDNNNHLIITTDFGLCAYDFTKFYTLTVEDRFQQPIYYNNNYEYRFLSCYGILSINLITSKKELLFKTTNEAIGDFFKIDNHIWFTFTNKNYIGRINLENHSVDTFNLKFSKPITRISNTIVKHPDTLLLATSHGIYSFHTKNHTLSEFHFKGLVKSIDNNVISGLKKDKNGNFWIAVHNEGLFYLDNSGKILLHYNMEYNNPLHPFLSLNKISCLYIDKADNLWVGTDGCGFCIIDPKLQLFKHITKDDKQIISLSTKFVKCFYQDKNDNLFVGTHAGGLNIINLKTNTIKIISNQEIQNNLLSTNTINSIERYNKNKLIFACDFGVALFDIPSQKISYYFSSKNLSEDFRVFSTYKLHDSVFLLCTTKGLYKFTENKEFKFVNILNSNPSTIYFNKHKNNWMVLMRTRNPNLLKSIDSKDSALLNFDELKKLPSFSIKHIDEGENKILWAASNIGLLKMNINYELIKIYTQKDGLPDSYLYGFLIDKEKCLWISTNNGLSKFNPKTEVFRNFTIKDGLQSNEFNSGAFYKNSDGIMFFGGINGFNYFNPETIKDDTIVPQIVLTDIQNNLKTIQTDSSIFLKKHYTFEPDENTLIFEVAALEYKQVNILKYAFRLDGFEKQWYYSGNKRFVRYSMLAPGHYKLMVKATNHDEVWTKEKCLLSFYIKPYFYQTTIFKLLSVLCLIIIVGLVVTFVNKYRFRKKEAELQRLRELEQIRMSISKDIHDSAGATLSKISLLSDLTKNEFVKQIDITPKLNQLSTLARNLVDNLSQIVWAVNPKHDNLDSLLAYIRRYASDFFENSDIDCKCSYPEQIPEIALKPDFRQNLFLFTKEALNNALKYSKATQINIKFLLSDTNEFEFTISDNGKGFDVNSIGKFSNGIRNMHKRISDINCKLDLQTGNSIGTVLQVTGNLSYN